MKSMVRLVVNILKDVGLQAGIDTARDAYTIASRVAMEGDSFLTITLPQFEKEFTQSLAVGYISPMSFPRWKRKKGTERPSFLGALMAGVFHDDGSLRTDNLEEQAAYVGAIRQVCLLFSKVEAECTDKRVQAAFNQYVKTDKEIPDLPHLRIRNFQDMANRLFLSVFDDVEKTLYESPQYRHSSGALATRESYNGRFSSRVWSDRLQKILPDWDFFDVNWRHAIDEPSTILSRGDEPGCRVITVPKTAKTPRIIAMEPSYNNFVQQGVLSAICEAMESPVHAKLRSAIYWKDQGPNRELARVGSVDGSLATIDLSEASDRVSLQLVRDGLLSLSPYLRQISLASRSEKADLPSGESLHLRKFASMGSALTFPFETMVFYTIVCMAWQNAGRSLPLHGFLTPSEGVRIYGDDIVVPTQVMPYVVDLLEAYGLKVNATKSFGSGYFRESCGADWYRGAWVTPVRVRTPLVRGIRPSPDSIRRNVDLHNRLYYSGYYRAARQIRRSIRARVYVPSSPVGSEGIAFWTWEQDTVEWRFNKNLHTHEYKTLIPKESKPADPLSGWGALRKFFVMDSKEPMDKDHLLKDGRSRCVKLIIGWSRLG